MYKKILVPLDGSRRAEVILPHVEEMAHRYDAEIILLQIVEPMGTVMEPYGAGYDYRAHVVNFQEQLDNAEQYLAGWAGELRAKGITVQHIVENGPVVQRILEVAARTNSNIIAMASHGRTGLARVFYGSVAAGVLHQTDRPLLLIRAAIEG